MWRQVCHWPWRWATASVSSSSREPWRGFREYAPPCSPRNSTCRANNSVFQLVLERAWYKRNWAQSSARTTQIRAQFSAQTTQNRAQFRARTTKSSLRANDQNSVTIQHVNETRSGYNFVGDWWKHGHKSASIYKHVYIGWLKTQKHKLHFVYKK